MSWLCQYYFLLERNCNYKTEVAVNHTTVNSVQAIQTHYKDSDRVVCNIEHFNWTILDCYFNFKYEAYNGFSKDYIGKTTWLIYSGTLEEDFINQIESNSGSVDFINSGNIANYGYDLYKVSFDGGSD